MTHTVIASKDSRGVLTAIRYFASKWDREVGDRIRFEGEEYIVQTILDNKVECLDMVDSMARLQVKLGRWEGVRTVRSKF